MIVRSVFFFTREMAVFGNACKDYVIEIHAKTITGNGVFEFSRKKVLSAVKLCVVYDQGGTLSKALWLSGHYVRYFISRL